MNILFVCTGNTCRSPMAMAIASKLLPDIKCHSAGLFVPEALPATKEAILAAKKYDVDLSSHRATPLTNELISQADVIITMTAYQKELLCLQFGNSALFENCFTLAEFAGETGDILDPFGLDQATYDQCCARIYALLLKIKQNMEGC